MSSASESSIGIGDTILSRFTQVQLPSIHLENIYIHVGDYLSKRLTSELVLWTHSDQFRQNGTVIPIIMALFTPFSAVNWLSFNSTTLELTGHAPFTAVSYNVSITLVPAFMEKIEDIFIPPQLNSTPMTFATASFSLYVLGEQPADTNLRGWIPYLVVALVIIAVMGFAFALATCCWQGICSWLSSCWSRSDGDLEEANDCVAARAKPARNRRLRHLRNMESTWSLFGKTSHLQDTHVTPYNILAPSPKMQWTSPQMVKQRCFIQDETPMVPETVGGIQYVNIVAGSSFAVKIRICHSILSSLDTPLNFQARVTSRAPEWIRFCAEGIIVWGTVPLDLTQSVLPGFDVFVTADSYAYALAKLSVHVLVHAPPVNSEPSLGQVFSGFGDGVWYESANGVDILNVLSGISYCVKYHPRALQGQPFHKGRYYFDSIYAPPRWLGLNSLTLEIAGNTTGYRRRDLRDILVLDQHTKQEVAKLRIVLVIVGDKLG